LPVLLSQLLECWDYRCILLYLTGEIFYYSNIIRDFVGQAPVAHACNPTYSGGRDQKTEVQSQPRQIVHKTLCRKKKSPKRAGGVAQGVGPEFKPQYCQKKKKILLK
jgi:hypothetical protein